MTSGAKTGEQSKPEGGLGCTACKAIGVPCAVESQATTLRTRPGWTLALATDVGETAFIIREGLFTLQVKLPNSARQITTIYFPGDIVRPGFAPPHAEASLVAASAGDVWRIRAAALDELAASEPAVRRYVGEAMASRLARQALHAVTLGKFDCEQKVATLLTDLALRSGTRSPGGLVFPLPLSRKDIADYLGLNPDTLSRVMSRFKAAGLFSQTERGRIVLRDFAALAARSPAAKSLIEMRGGRRPEEALQPAL
jgi:CRP/FNR family transcriptional regulator